MEKAIGKQTIGLCNSVIMVADKFIDNMSNKQLRSVLDYCDWQNMQKLKVEAQILKVKIEYLIADTSKKSQDEIQENTNSMEEKLVELDPEFEMRDQILSKESGMN